MRMERPVFYQMAHQPTSRLTALAIVLRSVPNLAERGIHFTTAVIAC